MSLFSDLAAQLPFLQKPHQIEQFFALNIGPEKLDVALWSIENGKLQITNSLSAFFKDEDEILKLTDEMLDRVLGPIAPEKEPGKILFGVPDSWLLDDSLKEPYLKLLRALVKELELTPMAYVATSHAIIHLLEKQESVPATAVLVGIGEKFLTVTLSRAGKVDGSRVIKRENDLGNDVEKALLTFVDVEVLPSKLLIYGSSPDSLQKHKNDILSFPWMSKLPFLHLPKIDILQDGIEIKGIALAGAVEIDPEVKFAKEVLPVRNISQVTQAAELVEPAIKKTADKEQLGFMVGDITEQKEVFSPADSIVLNPPDDRQEESSTADEQQPPSLNIKQQPIFENVAKLPMLLKSAFSGGKRVVYISGILIILAIFMVGYLLLPKASVLIYVEPQILDRDTQVTADPSITVVDEEGKKIPAQIVEIQVSGTEKSAATGQKEVGDAARGTVKLINNTNKSYSFSKGTTLSSGGLKFTIDSTVNIASTSATSESKTTQNASVSAAAVGADSNIPSGTQFTIAGVSSADIAAISEGNFSGGTSKKVTVVTDADQKKLLASLAASLRKQAQSELQAKHQDRKVLEEALSEEIIKRTYNKNINDQANEFSLNLTVKFKGAAYLENDLKTMVAKLVETNVPENFMLNLAEAETQADVSKVEKDGRVIFLAKFRAKLLPKIDTEKIKGQIKGKTPYQAAEILRNLENVLGSEIKITPSFFGSLSRLPLLNNRISVEVGLK